MSSRQPPTRAGYRRNGLQASCETCRKRKTKCDHRRPVCTYCDTHQLQCFYHPAPMSKPRSKPGTASNSPLSQHTVPSQQTPPEISPHNRSTPNQDNESSILQILSSAESGVPIPKTFVSQLHEQRTEARNLDNIKEILASLRFLPHIAACVKSFVCLASFSHIPRYVVEELLVKLPLRVNKGTIECAGGIETLAARVLASSSSAVRVPIDADMYTFCDIFTGSNLRIETIGLLLTLTAMNFLFHRNTKQVADPELVSEMLYCGRLSLELARTLAPEPNDVLLWLSFANMCLIDFLEGATSVNVWRRMCDLSIDMFALDIHRESSHSADKLPFYLSEIRKRIFATTNHFDKVRAVEMNRQPCIRLQYADCAPPLDIPEKDLFSPTILADKHKIITESGWNRNSTLSVMSASRVRHMVAHFQEELIDTKISTDSDRDTRLRQLSTRLSAAWDELPQYVKYTDDCWTSIDVWNCLVLATLYLDYNNIQFNLLSPLKSSTYIPMELVTTSWQMLELVLRISKEQNSGRLSTEDLPTMLLSHGVPSAALLLNALQDANEGSPRVRLPAGVQRAAVIKKVSVLISQLDIAATKTESNHFICERAAKFISDCLDAVLDPPSAPTGTFNTDSSIPDGTLADPPLSSQDGWFDIPSDLLAGYPSLVEQGWPNWTGLNMDYYAVPDLHEP